MTHNEIPQPSRHWMMRIGLPVALLAAVAGLLIAAAWSSLVPAPSVPTATALLREIETDVIADAPEDESAVILAPGWVEPEPWSIYAGALAEGVVETVLVLEGDTVQKGQAVAQLVPDEARITLQSQEATVRSMEANVSDARASARVIPAQVSAAEAALKGLEDEYRRKEGLVESGAVAEGPLERLGLRIEAARAELERLDATRDVALASIEAAEAALSHARAHRDLAALRLERMTVRSPADGVVIELMASPGSLLRFGPDPHASHVVHLYDPTMLQVRADIPLADAASVGAGQPARITVDLLPDTEFTGTVTRFVHRADLQKNTVEAKVHIDDPSSLLKPDMLARVRILPAPAGDEATRQRLARVLVPAEALIDGSVWVVEGEDGDLGTVRRSAVRTGPGVFDGWVEIVEGVRPGDRVILDPTGLDEGDRVRARAKAQGGGS